VIFSKPHFWVVIGTQGLILGILIIAALFSGIRYYLTIASVIISLLSLVYVIALILQATKPFNINFWLPITVAIIGALSIIVYVLL